MGLNAWDCDYFPGKDKKMEQFEKWNHIHYINDLRISDKITAKHRKQERNKGWKAALKWALTTQGRFDWRFSSMISPLIIEKELEE